MEYRPRRSGDRYEPPPRLWNLRRVISIAETVSRGGAAITLFSLDDFEEGFAVRLRMALDETHPLTISKRREQEETFRRREQAEQRGELAAWEAEQLAAFRARGIDLPHPEILLKCRDERGDTFRVHRAGGSWGSNLVLNTEFHYTPARDRTSRTLHLEAPEITWTSGPTVAEDPEVVETQAGPWSFRVDV